MTDAFAVAAVTDTLRAVLQPVVGGTVPGATVDSRPPDELANETGVRVLNVFLYRICIGSAHRNEEPAGLRGGESAAPALPLVLHYLLTPYVADDTENEVVAQQMLGAAMSRIHDHPVLRREDIAAAAPYSDLHEQIERVRFTFDSMSVDEISKLWTAFQTKYRTSAAYEARVVLIDSTRPVRAALPVLRRGPQDTGPDVAGSPVSPFPALLAVELPAPGEPALTGGEVVLRGANLAADAVTARLSHRSLPDPVEVPAALVTAERATFQFPEQPADVPAGLWSVALVLTVDGDDHVTNDVPLAVAPQITSPLPMAVARESDGSAVVDPTCTPHVRPGQRVWLLLGDRQADAGPIAAVTDTVSFRFPEAPVGTRPVRLRVDGVDSPLIDRSVTPPVFDPDQVVTVT